MFVEKHNLYENLLDERLKEIEFWKRKYINNLNNKENPEKIETISKIFNFFCNYFELVIKFNQKSEFLESFHSLQKCIKKNYDSDLFQNYFTKIEKKYSDRFTSENFIEKQKKIENILKDFQNEFLILQKKAANRSEKTFSQNIDNLKKDYFDSIENFRKDLKELIEQSDKKNNQDVITLCNFHLIQLNVFNKILLKENNFLNNFVFEIKSEYDKIFFFLIDNIFLKIKIFVRQEQESEINLLEEFGNLEKEIIVV